MIEPKKLLETASEIVNGERQRAYGHPLENHRATAEMWSAWLNRRLDCDFIRLEATDVCWLNVLQKASRQANMDTDDNLVDVVGYVLNMAMINEKQAKGVGEE